MATDLSGEVALGEGGSRRKEKRMPRTGGLFPVLPLAASPPPPHLPATAAVEGGGGGWCLGAGAVTLESPREGDLNILMKRFYYSLLTVYDNTGMLQQR
jgi:hypothetical protein